MKLQGLGVLEAVANGFEIICSLRDSSVRFLLTTYIVSHRQKWYRSRDWVRVEVRVSSCVLEDT